LFSKFGLKWESENNLRRDFQLYVSGRKDKNVKVRLKNLDVKPSCPGKNKGACSLKQAPETV